MMQRINNLILEAKMEIVEDIKTKICNRCKKKLPLSNEFFHTSKFLLDGYNSHCKECRKTSYHLSRDPIQNLEKLLNRRFSALKSRIKNKRVKYDVLLDFDVEYLLKLWNDQSAKCALSNIDMTYILYAGNSNTNVSIDRIDSSI